MPRTRRAAAAALAAATLAAAVPAHAQQEPADDAVKRDLFAVIALEGKPCGEVTRVQRLGESDYVATCQTGHRYRVRIVNGRVSIEEQ